MNSIKGRIAIVTGAGRGIGRAFVTALLNEGVKVFATSRHLSALEKIEDENLALLPADLTDLSSFKKIVTACAERFGGIDFVINNAGYAKKGALADATAQDWDLHFAVNARAPFLLNNAAMPYLEASEQATIVNICSVVSTQGYESQGAYSAAKHALLGYTKVLAKETFDKDIRVHAISPGGVATELIQETRPDLDLSILSTPEEIADILVFLLKNRGGAVMDEISVRRYTKKPWM